MFVFSLKRKKGNKSEQLKYDQRFTTLLKYKHSEQL
jgi:hypothetical protein